MTWLGRAKALGGLAAVGSRFALSLHARLYSSIIGAVIRELQAFFRRGARRAVCVVYVAVFVGPLVDFVSHNTSAEGNGESGETGHNVSNIHGIIRARADPKYCDHGHTHFWSFARSESEKSGPEGPPRLDSQGFMSQKGRSLCSVHGGEFGVGLEATFTQIDAFVFLFLGDADTDSLLQNEPNGEAGKEYPRED